MKIIKKPVIFDNDCLSSFAWIQQLGILNTLFPNNIIIPEPVYDELSKMKFYPNYSFVFYDVDKEITAGNFQLVPIPAISHLSSEYLNLIDINSSNPIGKGEASAIVIAKSLKGTLASNNLRDILPKIGNDNPPYITTEMILYQYFKDGFINESVGQQFWLDMKNKKRSLPSYDFSEVINKYK